MQTRRSDAVGEGTCPGQGDARQAFVPYAVHTAVGDRAKLTVDTARRLRCDEIVMATSRKNALTRLVESSITDRVIELTTLPVEIIAGEPMSKWERYGIPGAIAALTALVLALED